jgi:phosphoglycolate phosphatase-like HAD superfamily hydrolase
VSSVNQAYGIGNAMNFIESVFWDFDGVIKDSIDVKTQAFAQLFKPFGSQVIQRVVQHHRANGGISRFKKIPLYITWADIEISQELIDHYCEKFSVLVKQAVIDAPWVPGVLDYLHQYHLTQQYFLVTATPQSEIEEILADLEIRHFFKRVIGAPTEKSDAIRDAMNDFAISPALAVMIGDSETDLNAALDNGIGFILRKTSINGLLQESHNGTQLENFLQ